MAREFLMQFANMAFTKDQELVFEFSQQRRGQQQNDKLPTVYTLKLFVRKMEGITFNSQPQEVYKNIIIIKKIIFSVISVL